MQASGLMVLLVLLGSCSTPQSIIDKSKASTDLYSEVDVAYQALRDAIGQVVARNDLQKKILEGQGRPLYVEAYNPDTEPEEALQAMVAFGDRIKTSRQLQRIVDRFVRIRVIDISDTANVTSAAKTAFEESGR